MGLSFFKYLFICLPTNVRIAKALVFPVVIHRGESWTGKKAEHHRIDAFQLWCWRRLLKVSWTTRRSNQSILKEINSEYSLEGQMPTKIHIIKVMVFPIVMYGCESWTIKKAEHCRIDVFELWC